MVKFLKLLRSFGAVCALLLPSPVSSQATAAERDPADLVGALKDQLVSCWRIPDGIAGVEKAAVTLKWKLKRDGTLDGAIKVLSAKNEAIFKLAAEAAKRAVKDCAPFKLPPEKYDEWSLIEWKFDPSVGGKLISKEEYIESIRADLQGRVRFVTSPAAGRVIVQMVVNPGGIVESRRIEETSANEELDTLALSVIDQGNVEGLPIGFKAGPFELTLPMEFKVGREASDAELEAFEVARANWRIQTAATSAYLQRVRAKITRTKPVDISWKARPTVSFRIDRTGKVVSREILVSSKDSKIDNAALQLIDSCSPFPRFLKEMKEPSIGTYIVIDFSVRNPIAASK